MLIKSLPAVSGMLARPEEPLNDGGPAKFRENDNVTDPGASSRCRPQWFRGRVQSRLHRAGFILGAPQTPVAWGQMGGKVGLVPLPTLPPPLGLSLFLERPGFHSRKQLEPVFLGHLEASVGVWIDVLCCGRQQERIAETSLIMQLR